MNTDLHEILRATLYVSATVLLLGSSVAIAWLLLTWSSIKAELRAAETEQPPPEQPDDPPRTMPRTKSVTCSARVRRASPRPLGGAGQGEEVNCHRTSHDNPETLLACARYHESFADEIATCASTSAQSPQAKTWSEQQAALHRQWAKTCRDTFTLLVEY